MDDYSTNVLSDSKNEWSIVLLNMITPHIIDGFRSIFNEAVQLCSDNDEESKYLMTYQNLLARIPKWNQTMIDAEKDRIIKQCNCSYLEDILMCVHIIQLKVLSCVRVGSESKKINIDIPDFSLFIHNVYTNVARKLYSNIYLFEVDNQHLEIQKRNREFEMLVQTCIMNTIRDKMPIEMLLRQYIDETQEVEVTKVEKVLDTRPKFVEEKLPINLVKDFNSELNENIFEPTKHLPKVNPLPQTVSMPRVGPSPLVETSPKVGFSDHNSVRTFETTNDIISLGEEIPNLDFEELDLSKSTEIVDLNFEEL